LNCARGSCARSVAVLVVLLCLFPWAKDIYAALAAPLLHALPKGATMIATDVTGTFFVPLKVTLMAAFLLALPYVLWQAWAFVAPASISTSASSRCRSSSRASCSS
jgi:sec-independent protein translocase protein TatC